MDAFYYLKKKKKNKVSSSYNKFIFLNFDRPIYSYRVSKEKQRLFLN